MLVLHNLCFVSPDANAERFDKTLFPLSLSLLDSLSLEKKRKIFDVELRQI